MIDALPRSTYDSAFGPTQGLTAETAITLLKGKKVELKKASRCDFDLCMLISTIIAVYLGVSFSFFAYTSQASNQSMQTHPHDVKIKCPEGTGWSLCVNHTADVWFPDIASGQIALGSTIACFALAIPLLVAIGKGIAKVGFWVKNRQGRSKNAALEGVIRKLQLTGSLAPKVAIKPKFMRHLMPLLTPAQAKACNFAQLYILHEMARESFYKVLAEHPLPRPLKKCQQLLTHFKSCSKEQLLATLPLPKNIALFRQEPRLFDLMLQELDSKHYRQGEVRAVLLSAFLQIYEQAVSLPLSQQQKVLHTIRCERTTFDLAYSEIIEIRSLDQEKTFTAKAAPLKRAAHRPPKETLDAASPLIQDMEAVKDLREVVLYFEDNTTLTLDAALLLASSPVIQAMDSGKWNAAFSQGLNLGDVNSHALLVAYRFATHRPHMAQRAL
jgi:hypothetical protein